MERERLLANPKPVQPAIDGFFTPDVTLHPRNTDLEALEYGTVLQSQITFWLHASPRIFRLIASCLVRRAQFLIPSFAQPKNQETKRKLHPTAYLDGIRGVAALFVVCFHLSYSRFDNGHAFGYHDKWDPLLLPFIRLVWTSGHAMVGTFFVVSGYSLSIKPVKTMRSHDWLEFRRSLSSSALRRGFRLYLPCLASTTLIFILLRLGVYEITREMANDPALIHVREHHPPRFDSFWEQVGDWMSHFYYFLNVWSINPNGNSPPFDHHLWSISSEMRCSMNLFIAQFALAGLKPGIRMTVLAIMIVWCVAVFFYGPSLFYSGFLLAELHHYRGHSLESLCESLPCWLRGLLPRPWRRSRYEPLSKELPKEHSFRWEVFYGANFVVALYLCSAPSNDLIHNPGWWIFGYLIPSSYKQPGRFWPAIGAVQLVWSTSCSPSLQRVFENRVSQYLGKISFMMYILHGTIIHTVGYMLMMFFWGYTGIQTDFQMNLGWSMAAVLTMMYVIWTGDVFWRLVDMPSVKFARWIEGKLLSRTPEET